MAINNSVELIQPNTDGFSLPCGYITASGELINYVEVHGLTGDDEETLAAKNMPVVKKMNKILSNCTKAIGDITDPNMIKNIIPDLTQGDRMYLLFAIRRVSLGDDFPFTAECPECEAKQNLTINLGDLDIKKMPDPKIRTYEVILPRSGKKASMKVLTGRGEENIAKASAVGRDVITTAIWARMDGLDGLPTSVEALKKLELADRNQLRDAWQDHEGGVETSVEAQCTNCDAEYTTEVDMGSQGFFNPLAQLKAWKGKSNA